MKTFDIVAALAFAGLGVRSLVHWVRLEYEGTRATDVALYALFVTGRVGMWVVLATAFTLYALTETRGRAFVDDAREHQWLFMVFLTLGGVQLVSSYLLRQRSEGR
ncbi:MAG: hypothetical protein H0X05_06210 [Actinobacteria bacterium]|nr:hypothetical protein [Actinomycetota bacterium]